jgi:alkyl hydroperoxide reductase subunit AhpF
MPFLQDQDAGFIRGRFERELQHDVTLEFFAPTTSGLALPREDGEHAEYARQILAEVAALSSKIHLNVHSTVAEPDVAKTFGISRTPATAIIGAQDYGVRFYGMPAGYEFATLIELIIAASKGTTPVAAQTREALAHLQRDTHIQVFVTPT